MHKEYRIRSERFRFTPGQKTPHKISRSKIDLFLECGRCFYLDQRLGVGRPSSIPLTLNNAVDELMKKEFDIHREAGTKPSILEENDINAVPLQHEKMEEWRDALRRGVQAKHEETGLIIRGGVDDIWKDMDTGELIIVDYKATSKTSEINIDAEWQESYKRQMEVYQWLLRQNGFSVSNTGYFVYVNGLTDRDGFDGVLEFETHLISYTGTDDWVDGTVRDLHACLISDTVPEPHPRCEFCGYREAAGKILWEKIRGRKKSTDDNENAKKADNGEQGTLI